jgi:hypothetical protein
MRRDDAVRAPAAVAPVARLVFVIAAITVAVLMVLSDRYGYHRDELYFLDCARHLQASYVDQPVLTPLVARISLWLFGASLPGLRLWPALAAGATVLVGALLAREFGGGRQAQVLAALGVATAPAVLGADHIMGPTAFDLLAWAVLAWVVARIGGTGDNRLWVVAGVVLGLGLANKHSIGFFALALVIGALLSGGGRALGTRYAVAGGGIALLFTVPDLWWQSQHGWATIAMTRSLAQANGGLGNAGSFVFAQLFLVTPFLIWLWVAGLRFLWRSDRPLWRALAWSYGLLFVFFALTSGAKPYYLAGTYVFLVGAGAVRAEGWLTSGRLRWRTVLAGTAVSLLISLPIVLPVLPVRDIGWVHALNTTAAETVGWPHLVEQVDRVWFALPADQRTHAVIFTSNYGEAGAIDQLGPPDGLPRAVSGHNTFWWWGPGDPSATTVVAVAAGPSNDAGYGAYLRRFFGDVRVAATITNGVGIDNQEEGGHVFICTRPVEPWAAMWPRLRHYD